MELGSFNSLAKESNMKHPVMAAALEKLKRIVEANPEPGKIEIQDDKLFAIISQVELKADYEHLLAEKHDMYIDIHTVIEGDEIQFWEAHQLDYIPFKTNVEDDYALYSLTEQKQKIVLGEKLYAIYYPSDIHLPGLGSERKQIKKAVMKIHKSLL